MIDIDSMIQDRSTGMSLRSLGDKYNISSATAKRYLNAAGVDTMKKPQAPCDVTTAMNSILDEYNTKMTVRQLYYQLNVRQVVPLSEAAYKSTSKVCSNARRRGYIAWDRIEDRTRQPHQPAAWDDVDDFMSTVMRSYKKDIWDTQPSYFEVWLEKSALFGILEPVCSRYGVTLQVTRGYSSISAIYDGAQRFKLKGKEHNTILYLGDHDATGVDIDRSIRESFTQDHEIGIDVKRIGLLYSDIEKYNLPSNPSKATDTRTAKYTYEKQAELDALDPNVLIRRVEDSILNHLDIPAYDRIREIEAVELNNIRSSLGSVQGLVC